MVTLRLLVFVGSVFNMSPIERYPIPTVVVWTNLNLFQYDVNVKTDGLDNSSPVLFVFIWGNIIVQVNHLHR